MKHIPSLREFLLDTNNDYILDMEICVLFLDLKPIGLTINETIPQKFWQYDVNVDWTRFSRNHVSSDWLDLPVFLTTEDVLNYCTKER